jgi:[NiFe] hydrogenase diaphorase moiety large subunit
MTHHDVAAACAARYGDNPTRLLQILRDVQSALGHLGPEAIDAVATAVGLPRVRVEATATFYHLLHAESHGVYEALFSDNIVDHMQGKNELLAYMCERMWLAPEKLSEDGLVYVGSTSDIGLGDQGPAALVNGWPLPLLNHIEVAIRACDPCLSCATHALGQMPLEVELVDAGGQQVAILRRDSDGAVSRPAARNR